VRFTFFSSIYVLDCGHSSAVRSTRTVETGAEWHCPDCDSPRAVVDVVTVAA
jgi:hypothetical protein